MLVPVSACALDTLSLQLGEIEHPLFTAEDVVLEWELAAGRASLNVARAQLAGQSLPSGARLVCPFFALEAGVLRCEDGALTVPDLGEQLALNLVLDFEAGGRSRLALRSPRGEQVQVTWRENDRFDVDFKNVELQHLQPLSPLLAEWGLEGRAAGAMVLDVAEGGIEAQGEVRAEEARFSSADGQYAGENLGLQYAGRARWHDGRLEIDGTLDWHAGESYLHPLYLEAGPRAQVDLSFDERLLTINRVSLGLEGVQVVAANGRFDRQAQRWERAALSIADGDLAILGPRFIAPLLAPAQQARLAFDGTISAGVEIEQGRVQSLNAVLEGARFKHAGAQLEFGPISGVLPWHESQPRDVSLQVDGIRWQKLTLGAFDVQARVAGAAVAIDTLDVPVLDGRVVVSDLDLRRTLEGWVGGGEAVIEPLSMALLSEALGWPTMEGVLSASVPRLRVTPGELALEGTLVGSLFDGYVQIDGLRVLEPFGVATHMQADLAIRHLDLAQLTTAFEVGGMTGFIDADVQGLELAQWRPVRFDAQLRSSPGRYPRRISQRAVENIGALGGPGATLALQRGFLRFFESFGYREIGLTCRLRDERCEMGGVAGADRADGGFVIVRGGGVPALEVIGYNREVDWPELIDRLQRVIESDSGPVIE